MIPRRTTIHSARHVRSEPEYRAGVSQWQAERARGRLLPMQADAPRGEHWVVSLGLWVMIFAIFAVIWAVTP